MATLGPMNASPARQPFGVLNESKLRSLQSVKNRQNSLTLGSATSLKRRYASPETSDSENVDPNLLDTMKKRKRSLFDEDVSTTKLARYSLNRIPSVDTRATVSATPRLETFKTSHAPFSAPAAAGRSPTKPRTTGILGARKRFAPPQFGIKSPSLSVTAALNGTLANKKPKKMRTIQESKPKSWYFDIYEESQEQQDYNVSEWNMTQSAIILDISDDESKVAEKLDRGKENVDPNEMSMPMTRSMTAAAISRPSIQQKDKMTDESRTPLGDLNAADFYAEGLDATSVVLVQEDAEPEQFANIDNIAASTKPQEFTFEAQASIHTEEKMSTAELGALLVASAPVWDTETLISTDDEQESQPKEDMVEIEIWESESAKDENETQQPESPGRAVGSIFALQEL